MHTAQHCNPLGLYIGSTEASKNHHAQSRELNSDLDLSPLGGEKQTWRLRPQGGVDETLEGLGALGERARPPFCCSWQRNSSSAMFRAASTASRTLSPEGVESAAAHLFFIHVGCEAVHVVGVERAAGSDGHVARGSQLRR